MNTNPIDTLAEWYESAERITKTNLPRSGDYVISPFFNGAGYHIELEPDDWTAGIVREEREDARILARAPKPVWHDADFVVARYENDDHWQGYLRHGNLWIDGEGRKYTTGVLRDVTPLIEAKVTDGMVKRAAQSLEDAGWDTTDGNAALTDALTAALGSEAK